MSARPNKIAVKVGNLSASSQRSWGIPQFWEDEEVQCRHCKKVFCFTAQQQRHWYERKQKHICQRPVLCTRCLFQENERKRPKRQMDEALAALKSQPSETTRFEAAFAIIHYFQREKQGDVGLAVHLLRDILRANPDCRKASDWLPVAESIVKMTNPVADPSRFR